jgi:hypothetical protein
MEWLMKKCQYRSCRMNQNDMEIEEYFEKDGLSEVGRGWIGCARHDVKKKCIDYGHLKYVGG